MARQDIEAGRAVIRLMLNDSALIRGLRNAQQKLRNFGSAAQAAGQQLAVASAAMLGPIALATRIFSNFDDAMRAVKAVSQSTGEEFERLTALAKQLGASTSFTAIQVANLMAELGRAGFTASQIERMTGAVLDLARATGTDATLASGIMAATIRQFGLEASEAVRVADGLTAAANKSFNTVEQLGEALSYAGPVAADFGVSLEEALAILGTLGNVGIQASNAGTAVRRLLTLTGAEAEKMQGIFGVAFMDAAGNARPLVDVLDEVNKATAHLGTAERAKKFNEAFGLLGITGASALSKAAGSTRELLAAIQEAGGVAEKTSKEMDAGLGGSFRKFMSAAEGVAIAVGEVLAPVLQMAADIFTAISQKMIDFVKQNQLLVIAIGAVGVGMATAAAALLGIGLAAQVAAAAITGVLMVLTLLKGSLLLISSPLVLIGGALAAGAVLWMKYSESGKAAMDSISTAFRSLMSLAEATFGGIKDAMAAGDLKLAGQIAMAGLKVAWTQGLAEVMERWNDFRFKTIEAFEGAVIIIKGLWMDLGQFMINTITTASQKAVAAFNMLAFAAGQPQLQIQGFFEKTEAMRNAANFGIDKEREKLGQDSALPAVREDLDRSTQAYRRAASAEQEKLDALLDKARQENAAAAQKAQEQAAGGGRAAAAGAGTAAGVTGSFSAVALRAQGPQQQLTRLAERQARHLARLEKLAQDQLAATKNNAPVFA